MKIVNRFYVAHPKVTDGNNQTPSAPRGHGQGRLRWAQPTLADAIEHAREILEADPHTDHCAIVQIVKLVRRKKSPLIVEDVRGKK